MCYICYMRKTKKAQRLKYRMLRIIDERLYKLAKANAALAGQTLIEWLEDAIEEKVDRDKRAGKCGHN